MRLTVKEIQEAIVTLRAGLWPSSMGTPPDAWGDDPERQQQISRRILAELQQLMDGEDGPDLNILRSKCNG